MTRGEKAEALFLEGYNCPQSVVLAFADKLPMDAETAARLVSAFGGGMSRMREVCGAGVGDAVCAGGRWKGMPIQPTPTARPPFTPTARR